MNDAQARISVNPLQMEFDSSASEPVLLSFRTRKQKGKGGGERKTFFQKKIELIAHLQSVSQTMHVQLTTLKEVATTTGNVMDPWV